MTKQQLAVYNMYSLCKSIHGKRT